VESYLQGSFRLGTAIRPLTDDDDYDVDIVCSVNRTKAEVTQEQLKELVGSEIKAYSKRYSMKRPREGRRCWTQDYADEAQFHLDTLPAVPDPKRQIELLEARGLTSVWAQYAIAITDQTDANYHRIIDRWPLSNPRGYALWFESRMKAVLDMRRSAIALVEQKRAEDIPTYRARVPLQSAIQLLKFHRNVMFVDDNENKPISVIITTLAALSYANQGTVAEALRVILRDMDSHIENRAGELWVTNPTNPLENFADKWPEYPERREKFYKWLESARADFERIQQASSTQELQLILEEVFGPDVAQRSVAPQRSLKKVISESHLKLVRWAPHRKEPPWSPTDEGVVRIVRASKLEKGFRPLPLTNDGAPVRKGATLAFYGRTNVPQPYEVYWQVVNTGQEAETARNLRGGFDTGSVHSGKLLKTENATYSGVHSIECFVVKNGYLAARSGQFLVNIK
jgi:hypothetical protein